MKKIFYVLLGFFLISSVFVNCKMDEKNNGTSTATQYSDESKNKEPATNFETKDISDSKFTCSSASDYEMDGDCLHAFSSDGSKYNTIRNWVLVENYLQINGTGFSAYIKTGSNMNFAGLQIFKKNSYDCYEFDVYSDGTFVAIDNSGSNKKTIVKLQPSESNIEVDKFNRITVRSVDSGDFQIFVNGKLVNTLAKADQSFSLLESEKIAFDYCVKKTASTKSPAEAWLLFKSIQKQKK